MIAEQPYGEIRGGARQERDAGRGYYQSLNLSPFSHSQARTFASEIASLPYHEAVDSRGMCAHYRLHGCRLGSGPFVCVLRDRLLYCSSDSGAR